MKKISRIYSENSSYVVGKEEVVKIELTNHGSEKTKIYKVTYADESILFVGLLEHEIEYEE